MTIDVGSTDLRRAVQVVPATAARPIDGETRPAGGWGRGTTLDDRPDESGTLWRGIRTGPAGYGRRLRDVHFSVTTVHGGAAGPMVIISAPRGVDPHGQLVAAAREACAQAVAAAERGVTIVLASPVYIGATRDFIIRPLEERGFVVGRDVNVAFALLGDAAATRSGPRLVGGASMECAMAIVPSLGGRGSFEVVPTPEMAEAAALAAYAKSRVGRLLKRLLDISVSLAALAVLLPFAPFVALAIWLDDRGPILFSQERIGLNGRPFRIRKFRTMVINAEERLDEVSALNGIRGPAFQIAQDPRLTRVGGFLRKTSIDELPQLWNVLAGDMSLVGPRPAPPVEVDAYEPWHRGRLSMRPGITGLAQVRSRSYVDFDEKASLDLEYITRWSPLLDLVIMLRTVPVVFRLTGR